MNRFPNGRTHEEEGISWAFLNCSFIVGLRIVFVIVDSWQVSIHLDGLDVAGTYLATEASRFADCLNIRSEVLIRTTHHEHTGGFERHHRDDPPRARIHTSPTADALGVIDGGQTMHDPDRIERTGADAIA